VVVLFVCGKCIIRVCGGVWGGGGVCCVYILCVCVRAVRVCAYVCVCVRGGRLCVCACVRAVRACVCGGCCPENCCIAIDAY